MVMLVDGREVAIVNRRHDYVRGGSTRAAKRTTSIFPRMHQLLD